ncbi:MAG TPA: hypothetical protein VMW27_25660 [Thermoanaerobaculia bacterium]|nr:hypothetical protein [Thermoanaerobaculia bacterium]
MVALTQAPSSPQTLYSVIADGRVYASANGGVTWRLRTPPLQTGEIILDAVADPLNAQTVYLRTSLGLLRSSDDGVSWSRIGTSLPAIEVVLPDRSLPGVLWAATQRGLYRSADEGGTWQLAAFDSRNLRALGIDPLDPDIFLVALRGDPLYAPVIISRSTDHGATWEDTSQLPLFVGRFPGEPGFVFDVAHPGTTYVFFDSGSDYEALFRTADLGTTWTSLSASSGMNDLASSPDGALFAATDFGVSKSTDQGTTWVPPLPLITPAAPPDRLVRILASAALPNPLLAAGSAGLWASVDGGASWQDSSRGIVAQGIVSVLASPMGAPALTTVAGNSVYRSVDQGTTWIRLHTRAQGRQPVRLAALHPFRPRTIYGIDSQGQGETLLKSVDGGRSWSSLSFPYACQGGPPCEVKIHAVTLDPQRPETVYVAGFAHPTEGTGYFLLHSDDGFQNFTLLEGSPRLTGLTADPDRSGTLYGLSCQGLYKSFDAGVSWRKTGRNLPSNACATVLVLDPRNTRRLWVALAGRGLFFSSDGGGTFQSMSRGLETGQIGTLLFDPEDSSQVYAGVSGRGVYRWHAVRRQWALLANPGLPTAGYRGILTLDPQHPSVLYASHPERGIFRLDVEE